MPETATHLRVPTETQKARRTGQILDAVMTELGLRRNAIDGDSGIRQVTISVKMIAGSDRVRAVVVNVESEKILSNT